GEGAGGMRGGGGVRTGEIHRRVVLACDPQRPPAVVDAEGAVPELLEERHPAARPASRLEDAHPAAAEELAERRRRHLVSLDRREMDVVVRLARGLLRPVLLRVGLVEALRDLLPEALFEAHRWTVRTPVSAGSGPSSSTWARKLRSGRRDRWMIASRTRRARTSTSRRCR